MGCSKRGWGRNIDPSMLCRDFWETLPPCTVRETREYARSGGGLMFGGRLPITSNVSCNFPCVSSIGFSVIGIYLGVVQYSFISKPPSRRAFRGLSRPQENPKKLHLTTIKAYMLTHIILSFRRPFRRAFADLSRPQKSTVLVSHMFRLYINCKQGF